LGASQLLPKQVFVGLVGYFFNQVTGDRGSGAKLGSFQSRVCRDRATDRLSVPNRRYAGFFGPLRIRIWRVLSAKPAIGMELAADLRDLARATRGIAVAVNGL
jgi:hypothetical protein